MPCPFFEPQVRLTPATEVLSRFPLIFQYQGVCHASHIPARFDQCNQGYARGICPAFPVAASTSAVRFDVTEKTAHALSFLLVEEENHWPRAWFKFNYLISERRIVPEISDLCRRSQAMEFCRSYLDKF